MSSSDMVKTPEFRVSFPQVFKAKAMDENSDAKFSLVMLFDKGTDLKKLKQIAGAAVKEKWGDKKPKTLRNPFRDASDKDYEGYDDGMIYITASSKMRPGVINKKGSDLDSEEQFYGGCYAQATVVAYAYDVKGNKGVAFGLRNVLKTRDGDPFSGRTSANDDFADLIDENLDVDSSGDDSAASDFDF